MLTFEVHQSLKQAISFFSLKKICNSHSNLDRNWCAHTAKQLIVYAVDEFKIPRNAQQKATLANFAPQNISFLFGIYDTIVWFFSTMLFLTKHKRLENQLNRQTFNFFTSLLSDLHYELSRIVLSQPLRPQPSPYLNVSQTLYTGTDLLYEDRSLEKYTTCEYKVSVFNSEGKNVRKTQFFFILFCC